jgi:hypothetical protein
MPEPRDHTENRNFIETILRYIPGFRGYLEKEYRRESDDLQRDWLADRLQRSKRAIDQLTRPLADAGQIDLLPQVDRVRGRLDKLSGRIRGAVQGYSGFFDLVEVDEELLDRVYEHDVALMGQVDILARAVEELPDNQEKLAALLRQTDELERLWDVREDMLKGLE